MLNALGAIEVKVGHLSVEQDGYPKEREGEY